ncbi:MAG: 6-phosphogluconolactonase [Oscillatoriales cyanobacterium C42_A2020_001]|nr:6-phosphogluconolactonase [Leptolyngbyaceae cyanobacterium C42_A2020_001]
MQKTVEILPDKAALTMRALELILAQAQNAIAERGRFTIALSGGSTPKPIYEKLAEQDLPWDNIHVFWGDERYVPVEHPDSNEGMTRKAWLNHVPIPAGNVHPMPTGSGDPAIDSAKYDAELHAFFQTPPSEFPVFDLMLQGMGDDGHTASLFPHTEALNVRDRLITVGSKDGQPRITVTVPLINHARVVIFLVSGANKQNALRHVFATEGDDAQYPSRLIQPQGAFLWLLDQAAAEGL